MMIIIKKELIDNTGIVVRVSVVESIVLGCYQVVRPSCRVLVTVLLSGW